MNQDWIAAFEALKNVYIDDAFSNIAVNEAISHHKGCRDSFVRVMVKGTIGDTIKLDHIIDRLASNGISSIKKRTLIVIRMGLFAIRSMNSVPDHAAVNEAVSLAGKTARGTDRFVNAILRSYLRRRGEFDAEEESPALKYSFPKELADLISEQYGEETESILAGLNTPPPVFIRVNTLKTDIEELKRSLEDKGFTITVPDEQSSGKAYGRVLAAEGSGLLASEEFKTGKFSVQSLSSMIAVSALDPVPGSAVLDMCAAPGGKTTMIAEMMGNEGKITACDIYEHRLGLISAASKRLGISIVETKLLDGTEFEESMANSYDYVLADVPCSGLGVIGSKPEIKFKADVSSFEDLTHIQLDILRNAVKYAKPGGIIEYSTCTLNKNENESVIRNLAEECSFVRIVEMDTILPYNNKVGFYYCKLQKNA